MTPNNVKKYVASIRIGVSRTESGESIKDTWWHLETNKEIGWSN